MQRADVAVVGAGPAGLAATAVLAGRGIDVVLIDEQPSPGGQIYRQPPETFAVARRPGGSADARGRTLIDALHAAPVRWFPRTLVWGLFEPNEDDAIRARSSETRPLWVLALADEHELDRLAVRHVLLAPGAYDLPVAFPGWTLPGVMSAGGVQAFVKSQHLLPGRRFVLAGGHPLLLLVADQLLGAGADVAAVAFAQPRPTWREALTVASRLHGRLGQMAGAAPTILRLRRAGVPLLSSHLIAAAEGTTSLEAVRLRPVDQRWRPTGRDVRLDCDTLALGYGFVPSTELARQAGCAHVWRPAAGGWVTEHDDWLRASCPGISVAGEVVGVAGADQAEEEGRLAAAGILLELGRAGAEDAERMATGPRRRLRSLRRFSAVVQERFAPRLETLPELVDDQTTICRCEEVTAGRLREALAAHPHVGDVDAVKQLTRVGMGPCQGRFCHLSVAALTAAAGGRNVGEVGHFTARPPVKPVSLGWLAS